MLRKVHLLGEIGDKYGEVHQFDVLCVGEALKALEANNPGFMKDIKKDEMYNVCVGDFDDKHALNETTLEMKFKEGDIWISPAIVGKKAGVWQAIAGAALIVVGAVLTIYGFGAVGVPMMKLGAGLLISGAVMMLTPVPGTPEYNERESPDERQSFLFDGPVNTNEQGGAIPVPYGHVLIGSTVVSTSLDIEDIPYVEPVVEVIEPEDEVVIPPTVPSGPPGGGP